VCKFKNYRQHEKKSDKSQKSFFFIFCNESINLALFITKPITMNADASQPVPEQGKHHQSRQQLDEEVLQIKAAIADPQAFGLLYDKYYLRIFRYVFQRVEDEDTAGDVTSVVFSKALFGLSKYQFRGVPFSAWLFRVAQNELNQLFRKNKVQKVVNVPLESLAQVAEDAREEYLEGRIEDLKRAMKDLNEEELELLEQRYFENRSYKEMSEILDMEENNARVKTFRVIQKLKNLLTK
jgi:RNA polymerase sigma-70 factor (ECF subfamily)